MSRCLIRLLILFALVPIVRGGSPPLFSGTVVDASGAAISGATVQVLSANGTIQLTTQSDRNGPSLFLDSRRVIIDSWYRMHVLKPKKSPLP